MESKPSPPNIVVRTLLSVKADVAIGRLETTKAATQSEKNIDVLQFSESFIIEV